MILFVESVSHGLGISQGYCVGGRGVFLEQQKEKREYKVDDAEEKGDYAAFRRDFRVFIPGREKPG